MNPDQLLIADFLANRLEPAQQQSIQARIELDKDFAQEVRIRQMELSILRADERVKLKAKLKAEIASRRPVRSIRPLWVGLAIAASIAAIILIFKPFSPQIPLPELAMSYLDPFPAPQIRGESPQEEPAIQLYQAAKYPEAVEAFKSLDTSRPDIALMHASALMQVKDYHEAIEVLEQVESPGAFADVYSWNLALAYLLDQQYERSQNLLQEIAGSSHFKRHEAQELLQRLLASSASAN